MLPWLKSDDPFPPVETALAEPNGLLCAGLDLSTERILEAYRNGIFPGFDGYQPRQDTVDRSGSSFTWNVLLGRH